MNLDNIPVGAIWTVEHFRAGVLLSREQVHNIVPIEGLNHIAGVVFKSTTPVATWYIAPFEGNYTPLTSATAATIAVAATECVAYDEAARVEWVEGAISVGALDNTASKAEFTFNASKTIYGGYLISSSTKAGTTGVLISLVRFPSPKTVADEDVLRITTGVAFTSA